MTSTPLFSRHRLLLFIALVITLCSVYMLTYSARVESGDTLSLFNATASLVRYGDQYLDISAWFNPPSDFSPDQAYPLKRSGAEPLQIILASPLYWLADHVPGVGLVHTVWLFNVFVGGLAGGVLFLYALTLGYNERASALAALTLGLGTILWPYTKSLFQEPLALLMILLTALLFERWRQSNYRSPVLLIGAGLALGAALLTKEAAVFAIPALTLVALPQIRARRELWLVLAMVAAGIILLLLLDENQNILSRLDIFRRYLTVPRRYVRLILPALQGYLLSPGGSIWGTSPVVLLALPGLWLLYRRRQGRYVAVVLVMLLSFTFGYALLHRQNWFGGISWPPRYLVPVLPFLIIGALPVLDRIANPPRIRWMVSIFIGLALYSLWIQFNGISIWWGDFPRTLPPESEGLLEWGGALNQLQYMRWVLIPSLWSQIPLDIAWLRTNALLWPLMFAVLGFVGAFLLWRLLSGKTLARMLNSFVFAAPVVFLVCTFIGLHLIYDDPMYSSSDPSLRAMLPIIEAEGQPGDVVIFNSNRYERFFLNYGKFSWPRIITLPPQPGEQPSPEQPPEIVSDNPDALLVKSSMPLIYHVAQKRERLWLLQDSGPFITWAVRPVERFLAAHYYPIRVIETSPEARLIEYSTAPAPDPYAFRGPDLPSDLAFGDAITLPGYTLPLGTRYQPGDALPISLYWQADATIDRDYTVALKLANSEWAVVAEGADSYPGGGFFPTTSWKPNIPVWDNRALRLPTTLAPGEYRLWLILYANVDGTLQNLPITSGEAQQEFIGVLPVIIQIQGD
jgi:hypothetical protein